MIFKRLVTRRSLISSATTLLLTKPIGAVAIQHTQRATLDSNRELFRRMGGQVAAFFFGGWTQFGGSRNPAPWFWINEGFSERLPTRSVALPGHWLGWTFEENDSTYVRVGERDSARIVDARTASRGSYISFEPIGPRPRIQSPDFYAGRGSDFPLVRFRLKAARSSAWRCAIVFQTRGQLPKSCRVEVAEPRWDGGPVEITVDLSGNEDWMQGDIRNISIELGTRGDAAYSLFGRLELLPSTFLAAKLASIQGLPQDQQWAADWQQQEAYKNGIDALFMCSYWDGAGSFNSAVLSAMFSSNVAPKLKLALYFDCLSARRPKTLAEFDALLHSWNAFFASKRYWQIDGRPVLGWHGGEPTRDFCSEISEFAAATPAARIAAMVRYIQNFFQRTAGTSAPQGVYLVTGFMVDHPYWTGSVNGKGALWEQAGFDAGTIYNQFQSFSGRHGQIKPDAFSLTKTDTRAKSGLPARSAQTFEEIDEVYRQTAEWITRQSGSKLRYFMPASAGWDVRPWAQINPRNITPCSPTWQCTPDSSQFRQHLINVRDRAITAVDQIPNSPAPIVMINAWDEFGEGGFICPSRAFGATRLEAIHDTFGIRSN